MYCKYLLELIKYATSFKLFLGFCNQMYAQKGFFLNKKCAIRAKRDTTIYICRNLQHVYGKSELTLDTDAYRERCKMCQKL